MRTSRSYAIERGGPSRIVVSWDGSFRDVRVSLDGVDVEVEKGKSAKLPDGSTVVVRMRGMLGVEILRDGVPLPGSDLDPKHLLKNAAFLAFVLGVIDLAYDLFRLSRGAPVTLPLALDAALLALAVATFLQLRFALALAIAAFVARISLQAERTMGQSMWTVIFGLIATWLLATHFFAARPRKAG